MIRAQTPNPWSILVSVGNNPAAGCCAQYLNSSIYIMKSVPFEVLFSENYRSQKYCFCGHPSQASGDVDSVTTPGGRAPVRH